MLSYFNILNYKQKPHERIRAVAGDFFLNMPCVKQEVITEDVIRVDLSKDIFSPIDKSLMKEVLEYLNGFFVKVSFYNHKEFLID